MNAVGQRLALFDNLLFAEIGSAASLLGFLMSIVFVLGLGEQLFHPDDQSTQRSINH